MKNVNATVHRKNLGEMGRRGMIGMLDLDVMRNVARRFNFDPDRQNDAFFFNAIFEHSQDARVLALTRDIEGALEVDVGTWFGITSSDGFVAPTLSLEKAQEIASSCVRVLQRKDVKEKLAAA
jgi:hypothetical protein